MGGVYYIVREKEKSVCESLRVWVVVELRG